MAIKRCNCKTLEAINLSRLVDLFKDFPHHCSMRILAIVCIFLGGCATVDARLPDISTEDLSAEQQFQERAAFSEVSVLRDRLMRVAHPVMKANADLCKKTRLDIGALTHTLKSYSKQLRDGASRELGVRDAPSIIYVRAGSPADLAGLQVGDSVLDGEENALALPSKKARTLLQTSAQMKLRRADDVQNIDFTPEKVCGYDVKLRTTSTINAYATGRSIIVTSGMINFVTSDEELALIIGHELAHNELRHVRKIVTNLVLSGFATRYTRPFEAEADYVGMYYMARAGFELEGAENIWRRLGTLHPRGIARAKTHPKYPSRYLSLAATRAEIENKVAQGALLRPNMRDGS